jgi:plasmid replication initiation protein
MQKNLLYILLTLLKEENGCALTKYQIDINELEQLRGVTIRSDEVFKAANEMTSCTFTIYNAHQNQSISINPIAVAKYEKGKRKVHLEIDPRMLPLLFNVKDNYTTYQLKNAIALDSKHSKRVYEMMSQYKDTGWLSMSLSEFEKCLGLINLNTSKKKFPRVALLKKHVLDVAQKELLYHTDLSFTYQIRKEENKYSKLFFEIHMLHSKENKLPIKRGNYPNPELNREALTQYNLLTKEYRWLSKRQAYALVTTLPIQKLWLHIDKVIDAIKQGKSIKPSIYFKEVLQKYLQEDPNSPTLPINTSINTSIVGSQQKKTITSTDKPFDIEKLSEEERLRIRMMPIFKYDFLLIEAISKQIPLQEISQALSKIDQEPDKTDQTLSVLVSKLETYAQESNRASQILGNTLKKK